MAQTHIELPFTVANERGDSVRLVVGVDERATERIDTALGEWEVPPFPPPASSFYAVLLVYDSVDAEWKHTYRDFRPLPPDSTFMVEYRLRAQRGEGRQLIFRWGVPLPAGIDSAVLTDRLALWLRFDSSGQAVVENEFVSDFDLRLRVWYRRGPVGVRNEVPQLAVADRVCLYTLDGRLCWEGERLPEHLRLAPGLYVLLQRFRQQWVRRLWWQP